MARASLHVKRHLQPRELATIAVALTYLRADDEPFPLEATVAQYCGDDGLLSDEAIDALVLELTTARKVKVCRTKRLES